MPSKKKPATAGMAALPSISKELIEQLIGGATPMTADQINATTMALKKALIERALGAESCPTTWATRLAAPAPIATHKVVPPEGDREALQRIRAARSGRRGEGTTP